MSVSFDEASRNLGALCEGGIKIVHGEYQALGEEADLYTRETTKLQKLVAEIEFCFQKAHEARFFPSFSYLRYGETNFSLVQLLVKSVISGDFPLSTQEKAIYALRLLERSDPFLCTINHEMDVMRDAREDDRLRDAAYWRLHVFANKNSRPFKIHFPVRPYRTPKACSMPLASRAKSSSEIHRLFWTVKNIFVKQFDSAYYLNLEDVGEHEGIRVDSIAFKCDVSWIRDPMLRLHSGEFLLPSRFHYDEIVRKVV